MNLRLDQAQPRILPGRLVLREVSLKLEARHVTGLFGPNGSGKSTLLRCLNGSLRPQSGQVWLEGRPVADLGSREAARVIAVVSQDTPRSLPFTALELVLLGRYPHGESGARIQRRRSRLLENAYRGWTWAAWQSGHLTS